ncbi:MAG: DNA helicase PcrA [Clostridiales bacterium]|nr:DNA helicase PcrA [Clostridiales bacterium]
MENLLKGLNKEQKEAVMCTEGPVLILAGAGSGKTRVLTHRIAYLVQYKKVYASSILAITFTNKAANEMRTRVNNLIGDLGSDAWISTFHAACVKILRRYIERLGFVKNFVILDYKDQQEFVKECLVELNINEKNFPPKDVLAEISRAKDVLHSPEDYMEENYSDFRKKKVAQIYELYQQKLKINGVLDFDDIIFYTVRILQNNPDVLEYYQNRFRYIMVDEYQDTNTAQYILVNLLAGRDRNLCVVGDDDQSIYGWRGANIQNILDFEKDFKGAKVIKLEQNYRSKGNILKAANSVIKNNYGRKSKQLRTASDDGEKITLVQTSVEYEEAVYVAKKIRESVQSGKKKYLDFAVLYRVNAQSRVLEESLMKYKIPYKIVGGFKFYERKEIKDLIAYLRLIQNPNDDYALKRIINVPKRGIGMGSIQRIENIAKSKGCSMFAIASMAAQIPELSRTSGNICNFVDFISKMKIVSQEKKVSELIEILLEESGILKESEWENSIEVTSRVENMKEFLSVAIEYDSRGEIETLEDFLESVALVSDLDNVQEDEDNVILMTLHSAKGLEYDTVFLTGMEEGVFPAARSLGSEEAIEEERRLCYVGITRAKEKLYLMNSRKRTLFGNTAYNEVSRFISEIPEEITETEVIKEQYTMSRGALRKRPKERASLPKYMGNIDTMDVSRNASDCNFTEGDNVFHKKFGNGIISKIEKEEQDYKLEIMFEDSGMKRMMAAYANLERLDQ